MFLLFDIGASNMRLAVTDGKKIDKALVTPTPQNYDKGLKQMAKLAHILINNQKIKTVVGGVAGPLDKNKTSFRSTTNLPKWSYRPFKKDLEKIFKVPVYLENDAAPAALGEAIFGAGKDKNIVAFLTVSSGLGGARIVNKKIDVSSVGFEPGKQIIDIDHARDLEDFVSGSGLKRRYGTSSKNIKDKKVWEKVALYLAAGLNDTLLYWSPDIIVLGGGIALKSPLSLKRVEFHLKKIYYLFPLPPIKKAALGDLSGLYGTLAFLHQKIKR